MASMKGPQTRLLGFAPRAGMASLAAALRAVPGPRLELREAADLVAVSQTEPATPAPLRSQKTLLTHLHGVQRRLEVACQLGPFLPMDPGAAVAHTASVTRALVQAEPSLGAALARHGATQQWDIILRWPPESVLARDRAAIARAANGQGPTALAAAVAAQLRADRATRAETLRDCLEPAVLAFAEGGAVGAETEVALTVLVRAGREGAIEAALEGLPVHCAEAASLNMRGPLPPLSFAAVRFARTAPRDVIAAWTRLRLEADTSLERLHRQWRTLAAAAHPDRGPRAADAASLPELSAAYETLRPLLLRAPAGPHPLSTLKTLAGLRLVVPECSPGTAFAQELEKVA